MVGVGRGAAEYLDVAHELAEELAQRPLAGDGVLVENVGLEGGRAAYRDEVEGLRDRLDDGGEVRRSLGYRDDVRGRYLMDDAVRSEVDLELGAEVEHVSGVGAYEHDHLVVVVRVHLVRLFGNDAGAVDEAVAEGDAIPSEPLAVHDCAEFDVPVPARDRKLLGVLLVFAHCVFLRFVVSAATRAAFFLLLLYKHAAPISRAIRAALRQG